ncbi:hypothetical protein [Halorussus sp. MSC15.2]|uniref:hypothetical protein n=1 Tax=Halorussus sp. MSC15.2 TaxID=2283638 RepID=UPI0013CF4D22|nr:hypothetical protein [Halorussus sp. MSC15.2]NEU58595.1 hypothetical protein [Halorussus sp. MSC15.2]
MDGTPRERLGRNLKSPYPHDEGTFWNDLFDTLGAELEDLEAANTEVLDSKVIDIATGEQLDKLGELVKTKRKSEESDEHYRARLKVQLRRFLSGATRDQIKETAAILLNTDTDQITIEEDFAVEPGRFVVRVWQSDLDSSGVSDTEFRTFVDQVRSAGVRTVEQVRGTFVCRSEQNFLDGVNDPEKGYRDPDDSYENGTYAGII